VLSSKFASKVVTAVHPSSLLRQPDKESREREYKKLRGRFARAQSSRRKMETRRGAFQVALLLDSTDEIGSVVA